jgi:DNA-binding protein HU-beta
VEWSLCRVGRQSRPRRTAIIAGCEIPLNVHNGVPVGHNMHMNKRELARAVAVQADVELKTVTAVLDGFTDVVTAVVSKGEPISIPGFAKFVKVNRAARMGRNPATGETIRIKASKKARITPVKAFKDAVLAPATAPKLVRGAYPTIDAAVAAAGKTEATVAAKAPTARKAPAAKKAPAKRAPAKKAPAAKKVVRKAPAKKAPAAKKVVRKAPAKKAVKKAR